VYPRDQAFHALVDLVAVGDLECIDSLLDGELYAAEDRSLLWKIGTTLQSLLTHYDYLDSPRFTASVAGKSGGFKAMKTKLESAPVKRRQNQQRFEDSLIDLMTSDLAYQLLARSQHYLLDVVREDVRRLTNPDEELGAP
jgi:hypothetical protein